ncbi:Mitochondrial carrier protein [Trichomonas vaginalis G3]|uniref:Mitochondrial carrier protein n=1 Tax=Trichomonas vaginalis (strain ATCC PRA-98 / G3) TaxID=412133 RepID=A2F4V4_TRIV3|nr:ATP transmembrane transporter protein [Trichomonas vaginalis G3]EAY00062.1 Mitochondrial carrier protein [Trichomonas vaginalis G3]KAI5543744.1 ATP transmembrane transporter protein [Trichomonas vaginalis G3]|eukprot:XP_001312991.1 Mitochondrial carrier protein [Trichomonas vaginalis G3]
MKIKFSFGQKQKKDNLSPVQMLVSGFFGVIGPKCLIAPLDTIRVSKILHGNQGNSILWDEIRTQGFPRLFSGIACDVIRIPNQTIFRYLLFDELRAYMNSGVADMIAATAASITFHPIDVIHTLMVSDPVKYPTVSKTASLVWQRDGIKGFLCGLHPTLIGYLPYRGVSLSSQFLLRKFPIKKSPVSDFLIHGTVLTCAQFATYPFDLARKRMIADESVHGMNYIDVIKDTYKKRGFTGVYSGFGVTMARIYAFTYLQHKCTSLAQSFLYNFNYLLRKHKFD